MADSTEKEFESSISMVIWWLLFLVAIPFALYGRFTGLGMWPFAHDEFYFARSIGQIIELGVPKLGCDALYMRGVLYQYFLSFIYQAVGHSPELVFRLVNSFLSSLVIIPVWLLAKRIGGTRVALASCVLVALSLVLIETSRFLRMYAPFQTLFCFYVYFLYMGVVEGRDKHLYLAWVLSFFSIFIHITSMLVGLLNFTAFLKKPNTRNFIIPALIGFVAFSYISYDFRNLRSGENLPADFTLSAPSGAAGTENLILPYVFLPYGISDAVFLFYLSLIATICLIWICVIWLSKKSDPWLKIVLSLCVVFALLNQLGVIFFGVLIAVFAKLIAPRDLTRSIALSTSALVVFVLLFWVVFALSTNSWHEAYGVVENVPKKILVTLLKYPDFYDPFLARWFMVQPITVLMMLASLVVVAISPGFLEEDKERKSWFLIYILLSNILLMGILKGPPPATRYTLYLYPLILILVVQALKVISGRNSLFFLLGLFAFVGFSEDYSASYISNIASRQGNFREGMDHDREVHLWQRLDFRSPAEYVNSKWQQGDKVLIFTSPISYYLKDNLSFMYLNINNGGFKAKSACGGEREAWTMAELLYKPDDFLKLIEKPEGRLWVVARNPDVPWIDGLEEMLASEFREKRVFEGGIGRIDVFKFE